MIRFLLSILIFTFSFFKLSAGTGIYQSYIILQNGYYDALAQTGNPDFQGTNLGSFTINETFLLKGGQVKTWKDGGGDVFNAKLHYSIYKAGSSAPSFSEMQLPWRENGVDNSQNNQMWEDNSATTNILSGLDAGDYVLEIYFTSDTNEGTRVDNNSGNNYKATFSVRDFLNIGKVTVTPSYPSRTEPVTITLDASGTALEGASSVYFHSGVGADVPGSTSFSHTVGNWGQEDSVGKMTNVGIDLWQITIPNIDSYYLLSANDDAFALNFLFRSGDGILKEDQNGGNYHLEINPGFYFLLNNPTYSPYLVPINTAFNIEATSDRTADWQLEEIDVNGNVISIINNQAVLNSYSFSHLLTDLQPHFFRLKSMNYGVTKEKSFEVKAYVPPTSAPMPAGAKQGPNYNFPNPGEVTLVLHAPTSTTYDFSDCGGGIFNSTTTPKNIIYVLGDFNNWEISEDYKLNKDGDFWWITLKPSTTFPAPLQDEYVYQFLIDGTIRIGDPYGNKISDPDDQYISSTVFPGLITYPFGKANGRATVLELNKVEYQWQVPNFARVITPNNLNVYELHFRDFTEEGTYKAATAKLDYLKSMGINTIHVMPVSEFEGNDSWGYNPNYYFAADKAYGTANDLKEFIDESHQRGIAVVNDLVLNHAFYSNPNAMMYWDYSNNRPSTDNPWFNAVHKAVYDTAGHWGADWNHASSHTKKMMDDILDYWLTEFKFDGFRFDFTKGFTQADPDPMDPWASNYDACRVAILKRLVSQMWVKHPGTYAIFEHLANDSEDKALADFGILMWSGAGPQADWIKMAEGNEKRSFSASLFSTRGFNFANYMSYMESHDEERIGFQVKNYGANNDGSMQYFSNRLKLVAAFNHFLPGPRMVWQFGELGYDISINENGRTGQKPSAWELGYDTEPERLEVYNLYSHIFNFRNKYNLYGNFDFRTNGSANDWQRTMSMADDGAKVQIISIGNFDTANDLAVSPAYYYTGTWFKYNGDPAIDGQPYTVNDHSDNFVLYKNDPVYILSNADIIPPVFNAAGSTIKTDYCQFTITDASYDITKGTWANGTTESGKVADNSGSFTLSLSQINGQATILTTLQGWQPQTGINTILWVATDGWGNSSEYTQVINLERGACYKPAAANGDALKSDVLISSLKRKPGNTTKRNGILVLESKHKGLAITKVPEQQNINDYIKEPVKGMLIFDNNDKCMKFYDGVEWTCLKQKALPVE